MTWDSVPWFVGGGAHHSPEVARLLAYAATSGAQGIVTPGDLRVEPLAVPGSSVRVLAGACLILSKAAGGAQQTYVGRNPSEDVKGIAATGSGAGRSDLIVAQIKDPFMPGEPWADPADVTVGPYISTEIIPNVSPTTTTVPSGVSGIPLARIDIPANTATITKEMIRDLRYLALPRSLTVQAGGVPNSYWHLGNNTHKDTDGTVDKYGMARISEIRPTISIPSWATHVDISAQAMNLWANQNVSGASLVRLGNVYGPHINYQFLGERESLFAAANGMDIRALAGTRQELSFRIRNDAGPIHIPEWSYINFTLTFTERTV